MCVVVVVVEGVCVCVRTHAHVYMQAYECAHMNMNHANDFKETSQITRGGVIANLIPTAAACSGIPSWCLLSPAVTEPA